MSAQLTPLTRLTDRDERALVAATENRISRPLRLGPALAAVRRLLARRPRATPQGRESLTCHPPHTQARAR
ncbi:MULTISPECIES: hypothetical protein [Streptomyces]|uniref:Uncharacterized protein n=1 Tax=Streptomyces flavotricini TaxID=66888 RepID=A0ABS8E2F4_9ACTN|nr:hypothetical protein [Streptomyces flavotricini]MCC0095153.1 hypothetical protein [Streptomyces flavotricini]